MSLGCVKVCEEKSSREGKRAFARARGSERRRFFRGVREGFCREGSCSGVGESIGGF